MATVSQTITLQDRVTPVLNTIIRAMRSTLIVMRDLDSTSSSDFMHARNWERVTREIDEATEALHTFQTQQDVLNKQAKQTDSVFKSWKFNIIAVNSAITLVRRTMDLFRAPLRIADTMTQMNSRLALINDGLQSQDELSQKIYESAQRSRAAYSETVESVARLNLLAKNALPTNADAIKFAEIMNKSFAISGANVQEMNGAMRQMVQALSSGRLQGDEFVSVSENAPLISQAIQEYLGVGYKELRQLSRDAKLTSDVIVGAVFAAGERINQMFSRMPMTFEQTLQHIYNAATRYIGNLVKMFSNLLNSDGFILWRERVVKAIASAFAVAEDFFKWLGRVASSQGMKQIVSSITTAFRAIGAVIGGVARIAGAAIEGILTNWRLFGPVIMGAVAALMTFKAAVAAVSTVLGVKLALTKGLVAVQYAYAVATGKAAAAVLSAKAGMLGLNTALLSSPITWYIAGIMGIVGAITLVSNAFAGAGHTAETAFGAITNALRNLGFILKIIASKVVATFGVVFNTIVTSVYNAVVVVVNSVKSILKSVASAADRLYARILDGLSNMAFGAAKFGADLLGFDGEAKGYELGQLAQDYRNRAMARDKGYTVELGKNVEPGQQKYQPINFADYMSDADINKMYSTFDEAYGVQGEIPWNTGAFLGDEYLGGDPARRRAEEQEFKAQRKIDQKMLEMAMEGIDKSGSSSAKAQETAASAVTGGKGKAADKAIEVSNEITLDSLSPWFNYRDWDEGKGFQPQEQNPHYQKRMMGYLKPWFEADRFKPDFESERFKWDSVITPHDSLAVEVTGGKLDSDRELSKDLLEIWREFLHQRIINQYTTERPTVNATFGDVRETADVGKLITALENVVGQAFNAVLR